jgi:DNA-binding MarR family transcriptional regulator
MTEDDLMAALIKEIQAVEYLSPNDITPKSLAEKSGRAVAMIEKILRKKVENGELSIEKRYDPESKRNVNVYVKCK